MIIGIEGRDIDPFEASMCGLNGSRNYAPPIDPSIVERFVSPLARQFVQEGIRLNEWYHSDQYEAKIRAAIGDAGPSLVHQDIIHVLRTPEQFRMANTTMQRWVMAEPSIRELAYQSRLSGYPDTYQNSLKDQLGIWCDDYRDVTNGVVIDGVASIYIDSMERDETQLNMLQISDILETWSNAKLFLNLGCDDITDPLASSDDDPVLKLK